MTPALWISTLGRASLESALWIAAFALVARFTPRLPAAARCAIWWLASLKALLACVPLPALGIPLATFAARPELAPVVHAARSARAALPVWSDRLAPAAPANAPLDTGRIITIALVGVWLAGVVTLLARHVRASRVLRARWAEATPLSSSALRASLTSWLGMDRAARVEVRTSSEIPAPMVFGGGGGRILLPADCRGSQADNARMALAHEASHLARRDLLWAWIPALAECVFWFHPLLRWSVREYVQAREEACDAQALRWSAAEPAGYGEMLVGFGVGGPRLAHAVSCGSPHVRHLMRRLSMLAPASRPARKERIVALAALLVFGATALVPVRLVAARESARPARMVDAPATPAATPTPTVAAAAAPLDHATKLANASGHGRSRTTVVTDSQSYGFTTDSNGLEFGYGIATGGKSQFSGSVSDGDWSTVQKLIDREHGRFLWLRFRDRNYVVHDADAIHEVEVTTEPEERLNREENALDNQESKLSGRESEISNRESVLSDQESRLSDRQSRLDDRLSEGVSARDRQEIQNELEQLSTERAHLTQLRGDLSRLRAEIGKTREDLGRQRAELGRMRAEVDRKRTREIEERAHRWIEDGTARPIGDE